MQLIVFEIIIAWFFLKSSFGLNFIKGFANLFNHLLEHAGEGTDFIFGNMSEQGLAFFFLKVLCPIIFISSLIGIMQHLKILPPIVNFVGNCLCKISGMGKVESFNAVSSLILGQSENFIAYKNILKNISPRLMYTMSATAMSTVSMAIVGAYIAILQPKYVVAALILNMFSTFAVL